MAMLPIKGLCRLCIRTSAGSGLLRFFSQAEVGRSGGKREVYHNTFNTNSTSHGVSKNCGVLQKYTQNSDARERSTSKMSAKNGRQKGEILLEAESSHFEEDFKEKEQNDRHQIKEESGEAIDLCTGKHLRKQREKMAEQSTVDTLDLEALKR